MEDSHRKRIVSQQRAILECLQSGIDITVSERIHCERVSPYRGL